MSNSKPWTKVGEIGVDAGLCWLGDPCYVLHKDDLPETLGGTWFEFVQKLDGDVTRFDYTPGNPGLGVAVQTGYGDGVYPVYVKRNREGRVACVMVRFCETDD